MPPARTIFLPALSAEKYLRLRPGLEARACECYAVVKKEFERLLPGTVVLNQAPYE